MKSLGFLILCIFFPSVLCSSLLRSKRQSENENKGPCVCVPYYQCGPDNKIDVHGTFQLDQRLKDPNPVCKGVDICCGIPDDFDIDDKGDGSPENPDDNTKGPRHPPVGPPVEPPVEPPGDGSSILVPLKPPGVSGCGIKRVNPLDPRIDTDTRITGKNDKPETTFFGEFPWMVAIFKESKGKKDFICGGSLISDHIVLTAAHCISKLDAEEVVVRAGDWDSRNTEEPIAHQDRRGNKIIFHQDFDSGNLRNDIALLFLDHPFELNEAVDTICVIKEHFEPEHCFATGWGVNSFSDQGLYQPILKKVHLPIVDRKTCQARLRQTRLGNYFKLHESFICAGGLVNQDTCSGDGGGPMVCSGFDGPHKYTQMGIVSWGIGCGKETPAVYSSVPYFYDWIQTHIKL